MLEYSARFTPDREAGGFVVTFPDVPEAITQGDSEQEAMEYARDVLQMALATYMERGRDVPVPRKLRGKHYRTIPLPARTEAKLSLYAAMRKAGLSSAGLARRLHSRKSDVDRLLDPGHASTLDELEAALKAVGKRLVLSLKDAA
jgi:antitoxin HicB